MSLQEYFNQFENEVLLHNDFSMDWSWKGVGHGQFYFRLKDGKIEVDNECMSKEFIKKVLCQMVDQAELDCPMRRPTNVEEQ